MKRRMERACVLGLLFVLLLTGCVPTGTAPPVTSAPPMESSPAASTPTQTPPTEPPMTFTHEKFGLGETDNPRWYAETTLELIPRDDYGPLYPYPGKWRYGIEGYVFDTFGFCTADGVIVCDPAFTDLQRYEYEGKVCYTFRKSFGFGQENMREDVTYLAAGDGRFVLVFDEVYDAYEGAFAVRTGDKWGASDSDGNILLPCAYEYRMFFGEGLAAVTRDFDKGYEYVDRQGNTVFRIPVTPPRERLEQYATWGVEMEYLEFFRHVTFREGRALFWAETGRVGYYDKTGKVAIAARFGDFDPDEVRPWDWGATRFARGAALAVEGDEIMIIDREGVKHPTITPENYFEITEPNLPRPELFWEDVWQNGNWKWGYRDADGTVLLPPEYDQVVPTGECYMVMRGQHIGLIDSGGEWIVKRFAPRNNSAD